MSRPVGTPVRRWAIVVLFALAAQFMGPLSGAAQAFPLRFWLPVSQEEPTPEASSEVPDDAETDGGESAAMTDSGDQAAVAEHCTVETPTEIATIVNDLVQESDPVPECLSDPPSPLPTPDPLPTSDPTPTPDPLPTPTPPGCETDAACVAEEACALANADAECGAVVDSIDCAQHGENCSEELSAVQSCAGAPTVEDCGSAVYVAATNALCGVAGEAGEDCVPQPVQDLRGCAAWDGNSPSPDAACAREAVVDAVCGDDEDCVLRSGAVATLLTCTDDSSDCGQTLTECQTAPPSEDCSGGLRAVVVAALCDTDPAVCFSELSDELDACDSDGCRAVVLLRAACDQAPAACTPELRELEPCVDGTANCDQTFVRQWLGRSCANAAGANNAVCPRNPYVHATGGVVVTVPDGPSTRVPFQNGSSNFPYTEISQAVAALRSGGTNDSWALASPVKVRSGTYGRVLVQTPGPDEEIPTLIIVADSASQDITIDGAGQPGVVIPSESPGRTVVLGDGIKVRGGIQGPVGSAGIFTTSGRVNVNQPADYSVSTEIEVMPAPEPVEQRVVIQSSGVAASDVIVEHLRAGAWVPLSATSTASGLSYTLSTIEDDVPGFEDTYKYAKAEAHGLAQLRVTPKTGATLQVAAHLVGKHTTNVYASAAAAPVHVVVGQPYEWPTSGPTPRPTPTATEAPGPLPVGDEGDRLSGEDRSSTAAAVSRSSFSGGADTVYIATGAAYADALAAGPAAVRTGGPVLLVERDRLPDATRAEVQRLRPRRIVLLGGTQAIGAAVEQELARMTNGLDRIKGSDRYATAAAVSAAHFAADVPVVFVSSGEGFADALSGGAAAATQRGPVLLVRPDSIPSSSAEELRRLGPARIVVLGGTKAVSESVASKLRAYTTGAVHRVSGSTRYATSAAVSRYAFASRVSTVYIATGESFPDALAGVPAAGAAGSPLLLVQPDRLPQEVAAELDRLRPERIVILGGERSVSLRLERELRSYETAS